jgi:hypothetical protein
MIGKVIMTDRQQIYKFLCRATSNEVDANFE